MQNEYMHQKFNRLVNEKSPYLLQHAYNPVDWFAWSEEAFEKAKAENKPIFLSIGYSTCHWCHVMEHESFEDDEVADFLNKNFVSIKVDREERPDIDSVYMNIAQRMNGSGGWPLTIIMTPEQKPFFTGTYFPKKRRYNMKGLLEILEIISSKWKNNKEELLKSSDEITEAIKKLEKEEFKKSKLSKQIIKNAKKILYENFDEMYGGFGKSPKFPTPSNLLFLMRYYMLEKDEKAINMVEKTLESMYRGGIFDHIGFGFSRYSTDYKWLVPHFEKMLYDNAQLIIAYTEAYQITKNELYKNVVLKTVDYILREMTDENGGFYSAQDADSEGEEGKYYVFTPNEIINILGNKGGEYFNDYFGITEIGNFEHKNIPNLIDNEDFFDKDEKIDSMIKDVYEYRLKRTKLHKDDKILTSWNGMMIAALAKASKVFNEEKYLTAAKKAINFIEKNLIDENKNIAVRYRDGSTLNKGTLDDYAMYIFALLEMYDATYEVSYLNKANGYTKKMIDLFWDEENGGFFMTSKHGESLILRPKDAYDGAIPSGNSVACQNLIKLSKITGDISLEELSQKQVEFLTNTATDYPTAYTYGLISLMSVLYPHKEIICILKSNDDIDKFKKIINESLLANTVVIALENKNKKELANIINFIDNYNLKDNKTTYYICENNECSLPITDINELKQTLEL